MFEPAMERWRDPKARHVCSCHVRVRGRKGDKVLGEGAPPLMSSKFVGLATWGGCTTTHDSDTAGFQLEGSWGSFLTPRSKSRWGTNKDGLRIQRKTNTHRARAIWGADAAPSDFAPDQLPVPQP